MCDILSLQTVMFFSLFTSLFSYVLLHYIQWYDFVASGFSLSLKLCLFSLNLRVQRVTHQVRRLTGIHSYKHKQAQRNINVTLQTET